MAGNGNLDRIDELFLRSDGPRYLPAYQQAAAPIHTSHAYPRPTSFTSSSASRSGSFGARSSISSESNSDMSSQSSNSSTHFNYGYDLPCEFASICNVRFYPGLVREWIAHSLSHFRGHPPPLKTMCTFCNEEFDCSTNPADVVPNWGRRMNHIATHFHQYRRADGGEMNHWRPDFCTLEYLCKKGGMSAEEYAYETEYTERPYCDHTHPLGYKPREMVLKEERGLRTNYDLQKEDRERRRRKGSERSKGKGSTYRSRH